MQQQLAEQQNLKYWHAAACMPCVILHFEYATDGCHTSVAI